MIIAFYLLFMLRPDFYASLDTEFSVYCLCPQIHRHVGSAECLIHHAVTFLPQPETHKKSCVDVLRVYFYDSTWFMPVSNGFLSIFSGVLTLSVIFFLLQSGIIIVKHKNASFMLRSLLGLALKHTFHRQNVTAFRFRAPLLWRTESFLRVSLAPCWWCSSQNGTIAQYWHDLI